MHNGVISHSSSARCIQRLHPEVFTLMELSEGAQVVVSEPLRDLPGMWFEVPEATYTVIEGRTLKMYPFKQISPD
ncbi:hypothetical protein [Microbispora hainanensis]|uniref:hypothetical protein n=1 Tax=Microbispora hainanensis TaxID=568844 RepID=UPI001ABFD990|nr:hypothetical protein [Microbispora hainanensis]